jgi:hypothetical protein
MRVFRDETNLSVSPGLWSSIEAALGSSEYFILLISPDAAISKWISNEVEYWISHRSPDTMLFILTDGDIVWDAERGDFDWTLSAVPKILKAVYREEPLWVDLRWIRHQGSLSLQDPRFRDKIADIASTLLGRAKDELVGEDVRQQQRAKRVTVSAITVLTLLTITSIALAIWANQERDTAQRETEIANANAAEATLQRKAADEQKNLAIQNEKEAKRQEGIAIKNEAYAKKQEGLAKEETAVAQRNERESKARELAAFSTESLSEDPEKSILLGMQAVNATLRFGQPPVPAAEEALRQAILSSQVRATLRGHKDTVYGVAFSPDGKRLATASWDRTAKVWDAESGKELLTLRGHSNFVDGVAFSPDGKRLATASGDSTVQVYALDLRELLNLARSRVTRTFTAQECQRYFQSETCPPLP